MNSLLRRIVILSSMTFASFAMAANTFGDDLSVDQTRSGGSIQTGKGPGIGRDYQKSTPGPGQGEPEYRSGKPSEPNSSAGQPNAGKGKGGKGAGVGYPGYRGQGAQDSPQHHQYGSPPRGSEE